MSPFWLCAQQNTFKNCPCLSFNEKSPKIRTTVGGGAAGGTGVPMTWTLSKVAVANCSWVRQLHRLSQRQKAGHLCRPRRSGAFRRPPPTSRRGAGSCHQKSPRRNVLRKSRHVSQELESSLPDPCRNGDWVPGMSIQSAIPDSVKPAEREDGAETSSHQMQNLILILNGVSV